MELTTNNSADIGGSDYPKHDYIVWIDPDHSTASDIGRSELENTKKANLKPSTSYNVKEETLTPGEGSFLNYPMEIQFPRKPFSQLRERLFNAFYDLVNQNSFTSTKETNG